MLFIFFLIYRLLLCFIKLNIKVVSDDFSGSSSDLSTQVELKIKGKFVYLILIFRFSANLVKNRIWGEKSRLKDKIEPRY